MPFYEYECAACGHYHEAMQKMSDALDDIRMSSEGLGFMTEAQLKLSQSTEGMLKSLKRYTHLQQKKILMPLLLAVKIKKPRAMNRL